jgi:hypothetical protein
MVTLFHKVIWFLQIHFTKLLNVMSYKYNVTTLRLSLDTHVTKRNRNTQFVSVSFITYVCTTRCLTMRKRSSWSLNIKINSTRISGIFFHLIWFWFPALLFYIITMGHWATVLSSCALMYIDMYVYNLNGSVFPEKIIKKLTLFGKLTHVT